MTDVRDFRTRYGSWAVVAGASEGVGAELARAIAARNVHVLLLSRRQAVLDQLAASIGTDSGAQTRTLAVDLSADDATDRVVAATDGLDVGFFAYCAGADPEFAPFLAQPVQHAVAMVQRNCVAPLILCHHFAGPMQARGRGGIVVLSSGAALVGGPNMVAYGASKAFDMVMTEGLWTELHGSGVDVLGALLGMTDTPALRRLQFSRGQLDAPDAPVPGAADPAQVAADVLANLANGPTLFATDDVRAGAEVFARMSRNDAVRLMAEASGALMGSRGEPTP